MSHLVARPPRQHPRAAATVLVRDGVTHVLQIVEVRRSDAVRSRMRAGSLDRRLAAGEPPETDRLLAVRAGAIVTPAFRDELASRWESMLDAARRPTGGYVVPLARTRLLAAAGAIRQLVVVLRAPRPVAASGVAATGLLLSTATSPAFAVGPGCNPGPGSDLAAAVDAARAAL